LGLTFSILGAPGASLLGTWETWNLNRLSPGTANNIDQQILALNFLIAGNWLGSPRQ